jgi:N,N'-diacetylchitobiose transport system substrate-binding protein
VLEFGNTDVPKYSAAGALAPLNKSDFPNSGTWLSGLAKAGSYNGKLYGVPYYAGARAVIYRTDQYQAAGIAKTPKTLAEFNAAMAKLMKQFGGSKNPTYSAVYFRAGTGTQRCPSSTTTADRSRPPTAMGRRAELAETARA